MNRYMLSAATVAIAASLAAPVWAVPLVLPTDGTPVEFAADGSRGLVVTDGNGVVNVLEGVTYEFGSVSGEGSLSQTGPGNLILEGNNTFTNLGINDGARVTIGGNSAVGNGSVAINNDATIGVGGPGTDTNFANVFRPVFTTGNGLVDVAEGGYLALYGPIGGLGSITNVGPGDLYLGGDNSFVNLGISAGTVYISNDQGAGVGAIAIRDNATLSIFDANTVTLNNGITTTGNGIIDVGSGSSCYGECEVLPYVLTLNGDINGEGSISKTGSGILVLNGNNSFVNLGINEGTVVVGSNTAAGSNFIAINDNATLSIRLRESFYGEDEWIDGDLLQLSAFAEPATAVTSLYEGGITITLDNITTTTGNGLVDAGFEGDVLILNGEVNGEGSITQIGEGTLVLNGDNSFINLGISDGTVVVGSNTAAGDGGIAIRDNATLALRVRTPDHGGEGDWEGDGEVLLFAAQAEDGETEEEVQEPISITLENIVTTTDNGIIDAGDLGDTLTLNGEVNGEGSISQVGEGNLVLNGDNSFNRLGINRGTVTLGSDTAAGISDIAINDGATLAAGADDLVIANNIQTTADGFVDTNEFTMLLAGDITGEGSLTKLGSGTLILTGANTYTGDTFVEEGVLTVDGGTLASTFFVTDGATLGGNGGVGSVNVLTGGTISPGNSIGTLAVNGDYTQAAGGIYDVELGASGDGDLIAVTGTATLAPGAVANVINFLPTRFALGSQWNILTADGGRTGTFTLTGDTRVSQFISVFATYDANNAYLNVGQTSAFVSVANTPNQRESARGSDNAGNGALYEAIAYLPDAASARDAFDQTSGELHASLLGTSFEDSRFVREAIYNHADDQFLNGMGMWVGGFGSWGAKQTDGNAARVDRSIAGFFLGFDAIKTETLGVGVLTGYSTADIKVPDRNSFASTDDLYVGLYANYDISGFKLAGAVTNTWRWVGTRRAIGFEGFQDSVRSNYLINTFQVFGEVGYQLRFSGVGFEPFANVAYVSVRADALTELGGPAALSTTDKMGEDYWTTLVGLKADYGLPIQGDTFSLRASGGWRYVFNDDAPFSTLNFNAGPDFTVLGAPIAQSSFAATFSIAAKLTDRADFDIGYSGQYGGGWNDSGLRAALRLRF